MVHSLDALQDFTNVLFENRAILVQMQNLEGLGAGGRIEKAAWVISLSWDDPQLPVSSAGCWTQS